MSGETRGDGGTAPDDPAGRPHDEPGTPATWPALHGGDAPAPEPGRPGTPPPDGPQPDAAPPADVPAPPADVEQERFDADGRPLDPRAIARASLDADRNWSLWVITLAVVLSVAVAAAAGTPVGALVLAAFLACCAVVRAVVRGGPAALVVRSRVTDVTVLAGLAVTIGVLSQVVPVPGP